MVKDSLIKEKRYDYTLKCSHISDVVDLKTIKTYLRGESLKDIVITNNNGEYIARKEINPNIYKLILENQFNLKEETKYITDTFRTRDFNEIVIHYLIELIILIELKKQSKIELKDMYRGLMSLSYVPEDYLNHFKQVLFYKKTVQRESFEKNTNILVTNKNSYEFPRNIRNLKNVEMKMLIEKINLPLIEIPNNKDNKNTIEFLHTVLRLKKELNLKKWNFSLRIKKTKKDNEGMYITNANTIVIDPRHPEAFYHELGHYIYENKLAFTLNDKRHYPCHFDKMIKKFKKKQIKPIQIKRNKMEEYSDSSEIFSILFDYSTRGINEKKSKI
jgi:hypothetical protein